MCLILHPPLSRTLSTSSLPLSAKTLDLIGNLPYPLVFSLPSISLDSSMVGAKLDIHSDEEISPENPSPHSPPPPPAVTNRQSRRRRRNRPLPTPRSDPHRGIRRPRARRERGAKLSEVEDYSPVSSTPSPTPTRDTLDFGVGLGSAAALPVPCAPPPAMPVPVAPPPLFSDPNSRRRLPRSLFLFRRLPSWANIHGGVEAAERDEAPPAEFDGKGDDFRSFFLHFHCIGCIYHTLFLIGAVFS